MKARQWRVAARLGWRSARRNRVRSVLIVAMIALPVGLVAAGSTIVRTAVPNPEEEVSGVMGAADVLLVSPGPEITQSRLRERLPRGSRTLFLYRTEVALVDEGELVELSLVHADDSLQSPLLEDRLALESGRQPEDAAAVALHPEAIRRLGTKIGGRVSIDGHDYSVTGVVRESQDFGRVVAIAGPGAPPAGTQATEVLIDFPTDRPEAHVPHSISRNAEAVVLRTDALEATKRRAVLSDTLALAAGIVALGGVGLVAAAAFIVGARRQLRGLGIVMAAGGEPRHVRAIVLLTGTALGFAGSAIGTAFGVAAARAAYPFLPDVINRAPGPFELSPLVLAGSFLMGSVAATLAAWAPARMASRLSVNDALAARVPHPTPPGRVAGLGLVLFALGAAVTTWSMSQRQGAVVAAGLLLMLLAVFSFIPSLVGLVGKVGNRLPLPGRQAARDASRHGRRTAAAIGAAVIALSVPVALASHSLSEEAFERRRPHLAEDQLLIGTTGSIQGSVSRELAHAVADAFPAATTAPLSLATPRRGDATSGGDGASAFGLTHEDEPATVRGGYIFVGDGDLLDAMGASGGEAELARGDAVVLQGYEPVDGVVEIDTSTRDGNVRLPAVAVSSPKLANESLPIVVVSADTARELGFEGAVRDYLVTTTGALSTQDVARAKSIAAEHPGFFVKSAEDYLPPYAIVRIVTTAASITVALGLLAIVVALVVAESRRSHQVLAAVGSDPGVHRRIVGSTSGLLAAIAAVLAVPGGLLPTWVLQNASGAGRPLAIPWSTMFVVLLVTPILAGACAALFARAPRLGSLLRLAD